MYIFSHVLHSADDDPQFSVVDANLSIGSRSCGLTNCWEGVIGEMIFYEGDLYPEQVGDILVANYLSSKFNLPLTVSEKNGIPTDLYQGNDHSSLFALLLLFCFFFDTKKYICVPAHIT